MRKFLVLFGMLLAFTAEARQEPVRKMQNEFFPVKVVSPQKVSEHEAEYLQQAEDAQNAKMTPQNRQHDFSQKPHAADENKLKKAEKESHQPHHKNHLTPEHHHPSEHRPAKHKPQPVHSTSKSGVYLVYSSQPAPVSEHIVVTNPVSVVQPVVYENNIYAKGAYSCGERAGVKYCTDYRGRKLNGRIVQNYGENVAYENYRNGYLHGETTVFSQDGILVRKTEYKKSLKDGKEYVYFGNNRIEYKANYKKGALNGQVEQYNINGKKIGQMTYQKGYLQNRRCVYEKSDPMLLRQWRKNYNELILCADEYAY